MGIERAWSVPAADSTANISMRDVIGNKTDAASSTADQASVVALLRNTFNEAYEAEKHVHGRERWFGISGDQSGNDWALGGGNLTAFQAISGNGVYGADTDDEAKVLGTDDTPTIAGKTYFDIHRILVVDLSVTSPYACRFVYGTGTMAAAITAGQFSEFYVQATDAIASRQGGQPIEIMMPRLAVDTKVWLQCACATDNATMDFFAGVHEYDQ